MSYSDEDMIAMKVHEMVSPKIEAFTDSVAKEVRQMHMEFVKSREFDAAVMKTANDAVQAVESFQPALRKLDELWTLFCKNGYMSRFNTLHDTVQVFLRDRLATCPVAGDVHAIREELDERRTEALERAEGRLRTRAEDDRRAEQERVTGRRWRITALLSLAGLVLGITTGVGGKLAGWW